jgi:hypothetical protein
LVKRAAIESKRILESAVSDSPDIRELGASETYWDQPVDRYWLLSMLLAPSVVILACLCILRNAVITILTFHTLCCFLLPWIYMVSVRKLPVSRLLYMVEYCLRAPLYQIQLSFALFWFVIAAGMALYVLFGFLLPNVTIVELTKQYGLFTFGHWSLMLFMLYFAFINPVWEELFWRLFFLEFMGTSFFPHLLLQACCYALYHLIVLLSFIQWWLAFLLFFSLIPVGLVFAFITQRLGVLCAISAHCAGDLVIMLILSNVYFRWLL